MQAITPHTLPSLNQNAGLPIRATLGRLAGQAAFLNELFKAAGRQTPQPSHATGEPLRPVTFFPLAASGAATAAATPTTSRSKKHKKKTLGSPSGGTPTGLTLDRR